MDASTTSIRIVFGYPRVTFARGFGTILAFVGGLLLTLIAIVAAPGAIAAANSYQGSDHLAVLHLAIGEVATILAGWAGPGLLRVGRAGGALAVVLSSVFATAAVVATVTAAVFVASSLSGVAAGWVGATWRVVTLDDSVVESLGAPRRNKELSWAAGVVGLLVTPGLVAATAAFVIASVLEVPSLEWALALIALALVVVPVGVVAGIQGNALALSARRSGRARTVVVAETAMSQESATASRSEAGASWARGSSCAV
jgi:hypothetical protein